MQDFISVKGELRRKRRRGQRRLTTAVFAHILDRYFLEPGNWALEHSRLRIEGVRTTKIILELQAYSNLACGTNSITPNDLAAFADKFANWCQRFDFEIVQLTAAITDRPPTELERIPREETGYYEKLGRVPEGFAPPR